MSWGGLNPALTAWRNAYVALLTHRGTESDGARADAQHGSSSQHQADPDGTVDANDMDANVLGSSTPTATAAERSIIAAMKTDFERDPYGRGQLWISFGKIANRDRGDWQVRDYDGPSPHDHHVHWESRQSKEHIGAAWPMPATLQRLRELGEIVDPKDMDRIAQLVVDKLRAQYGAKWDAAASAWDDEAGRGDNRRSTLEIVQETRTAVLELRAKLFPATPEPTVE